MRYERGCADRRKKGADPGTFRTRPAVSRSADSRPRGWLLCSDRYRAQCCCRTSRCSLDCNMNDYRAAATSATRATCSASSAGAACPPVPPPVPVPLVVPPELVVPAVPFDVLPPQETSPAASTTVRVITTKPRNTRALVRSRRRPMANMSIAIRERVARAIVNAIELPNAGRLCDGGAEINIPLVGVACRVIVRVSVLPCAGLRVVGLKLQASQLGSAAFLSASRQEKVIGAVKPFTVMVMFAVELDAVRLTALGEIVAGWGRRRCEIDIRDGGSAGLVDPNHFRSGLASTPIWTVPQVVTSGVIGSAPVPCGGGSALKHSTEGLAVTCKTVGNVFPRSVERAKSTLNTSLPSPLIGPLAAPKRYSRCCWNRQPPAGKPRVGLRIRKARC